MLLVRPTCLISLPPPATYVSGEIEIIVIVTTTTTAAACGFTRNFSMAEQAPNFSFIFTKLHESELNELFSSISGVLEISQKFT